MKFSIAEKTQLINLQQQAIIIYPICHHIKIYLCKKRKKTANLETNSASLQDHSYYKELAAISYA
jgi:hypothetical protein